MSMIFPGMDPYLEDPQLWPGVHSRFVVYLADQLQSRLGSRYVVGVEERVYVEGPNRDVLPDVHLRENRPTPLASAVALADADVEVVVQALPLEIHESYVAILDRRTGQRVVTVVELLSPANKFAGPGRELYQAKQHEVLRSPAHRVEIDLLRAGPHVLAVPEPAVRRQAVYDYLVCVNRAQGSRDTFALYPRGLRERLPRIRIPLADDDPDVVLDVQAVLAQVYDAGSYRDRLDYAVPCVPPLAPGDEAWANQQIQEALRAGR